MSARRSYEEIARNNVAELVAYAEKYLELDGADAVYATNSLLDLLGLPEPADIRPEPSEDFYKPLGALVDYAVRKKLCAETDRLLFETRIMGLLTPPPSVVIEKFDGIAAYEGPMKAAEWLGQLSERCGAKEAKTGYPKCLLCAENVGFAGNAGHPARQTLRTIPFELDGENWFMQFSPFVYFEEHVIAIAEEHRPMNVTAATFRRMLDFIDLFPGYFIGSNAALPIVGGSILAHDHYQGGKKVLPIFRTGARKHFLMQGLADVNVSIADWYNSVVRLESKNRAQLLTAAEKFRAAWADYSDAESNILAYTESADGARTPHNAVTPIACINDDGLYRIDLILRNNRTDEAHPFGIFHPAEELHNIKQEAIGIIEVQGLFILPGRLQRECEGIKDILTGKEPLDFKALAGEDHPLHKHLGMIAQLAADHGTGLSEDKAGTVITDYINTACEKILDTTAVFKNTEAGQESFCRFIRSVVEG